MRIKIANNLAAGFTLIELVISAALMAMIMGGAYLSLRSGVASQRLIESRDEIFQTARVAMALMTADLRSACVLSKDYEFVGMHRTLGEVEADNLDFATHNYTPRHPHESDFCEISYFLSKNPETHQYSLWRRRDATPDNEPLSGGGREEIARGLRGLRFEYYDGFDWFDEWGDPDGKKTRGNSLLDPGNLSGLPEAVRITLWLDSSRPKAKTTDEELESPEEKEKAEPPLVFQTVARLNLADAASNSSSSSGSSTNSATGAPGGSQQGGRR